MLIENWLSSQLSHSWRLVLLIMVAGLLISWSRYGAILREAKFARIVSVAAWVVISADIVAALAYLVLPEYFDHIEQHVVEAALNAHHGLPLYPDWSRGEGAYGMLYG